MIEEFWHSMVGRALRVLQSINNIHRSFGLWQLAGHWKAVVCGVLLLILALFGADHLYVKMKRERVLTNAQNALKKGDMHAAGVFALQLLRDDPSNIAALKVITAAADAAWLRDALHWHEEVDKIQPGDLQNCLAWARTAMKLNDSALARQVLDKVRPGETNDAEYQWLAGEIAFAQKDLDEAVPHLEKAVALAPGKTDYAFDLAQVRLLMPGQARDLGRQELETLATDPHLHLQALRILFDDALRHGQPMRARTYFAQMKQDPALTAADRIEYINLLLRLQSPALPGEIQDYKKAAHTPQDVASLAFWMNANKMALVAVEWIVDLPPAIRSDDRVQLALGEAYVALNDWPRLKALTQGADWKDLDFLRAGLLARASAEEGDAQQAQDQWNIAILKAADNPKALVRLCAAALDWGWRWESQAEELAWRVANAPAPPRVILDALQQRFLAQGDTKQLYRLLKRRRELNPNDHGVLNNYALVSLLLKQDEPEARQLAKKAFEQDPTDARSGSTYAYSLYMQGDKSGALSVMSHFGDQLRVPSVALYNGIFLAAAGEAEQARTFLRLARRAELLPEEQQLEAKAEASIGDTPGDTPAPMLTR